MTDRPWMTAIEMQFAALKIVTDPIVNKMHGDLKTGFNDRRSAKLIKPAEAYAWSSECTRAVALAAKTVPRDACLLLDALPSRHAWWWSEQPIPSTEIRGIAFGITDDGFLEVASFGYASPEVQMPIEFSAFSWKIGATLGELIEAVRPARDLDDKEMAEARHVLVIIARFLLAGFAWIQQRVLSTTFGHIERHRRKQLAHEHDVPPPSDVKVIQLRRAESQSAPRLREHESVDWSCRWVVGGHWRNQPYKDKRELIYIMPYVKGPDDKPLKVPTHTVYAVNR